MRSLTYVAGLVAAVAVGMYQGPRETGIATATQGGYTSNCNISGIQVTADCPALSGQTCEDDYDPYDYAKPWTSLRFGDLVDCVATGCKATMGAGSTRPDCNQVN